MCLLQGTQERFRNSRGKRAINIRATEVLLYSDQERFNYRKSQQTMSNQYETIAWTPKKIIICAFASR